MLVGSTIGSGLFRSPADVAEKIPDEKIFLVAWIAGGLCVLSGALTYAELAGALPKTGGVFVDLHEAFGRLPAFLFGWTELTIIRASALGAISTVFAEYFLRMIGIFNEGTIQYVAAAAILLVAAFNSLQIDIAAAVQNLTASAKYFLGGPCPRSFVWQGGLVPRSTLTATPVPGNAASFLVEGFPVRLLGLG